MNAQSQPKRKFLVLHGIGYDSGETPDGFRIPCGRGDGGENPILYLVTAAVGFGSTLIVALTVA
jgi:hypothetical protein